MSFLGFDHGETVAMLRDSVRDFAAKEIAPRAADIDRTNEFPPELWRKLGSLGAPHVSLEFRIADPNGPVSVEAPAHAKPLPVPGLF